MVKTKPLRIVFIRHGQSLRNQLCHLPYLPDDDEIFKVIGHISDRDTPLSEDGYRQAETTGVYLRDIFGIPNYIFHSGYLRTIQTVEGILYSFEEREKKKIIILKDDLIRERAVGYVYNMKEKDARRSFPWVKRYAELFSDFDFCPPGGESLVQVIDRTRIFVDRVLSVIEQGKTVFIVSHGRAIQCLMYNLLGRDFKSIFEHKEGSIKNCSITLFESHKKGLFILKQYNKIFWK